MNRKQHRLSNRAARYRGACHFPRVVPETGLLRVFGRVGASRPKQATERTAHERGEEQTAGVTKQA
jgi:hypothetical protein